MEKKMENKFDYSVLDRAIEEFGKEENLLFYTFNGVHEFDTGDKGIDFMFNNL